MKKELSYLDTIMDGDGEVGIADVALLIDMILRG